MSSLWGINAQSNKESKSHGYNNDDHVNDINDDNLNNKSINIDNDIKLALGYKYGNGFIKDLNKSFLIFNELVDKTGNEKAEFYLAECYEKGYGVTKDYKTSFYHYEKSANNGYIESQVYLVGCYVNGYLTDKNYKLALSWIEKIADHNIIGLNKDDLNTITKSFTALIEKFEDVPYTKIESDPNLLNTIIKIASLLSSTYISKYIYDPEKAIHYAKYCLKLILKFKEKYLSTYYTMNYCIGDSYYRGSDNLEPNYSYAVKYYKRSLGFDDTKNDILNNYSFEFNKADVLENLAYCYGEGGYGLHQDKNKCIYWLQKIYNKNKLDDEILNIYLSEEDGYEYTDYQDEDIEDNYTISKNSNNTNESKVVDSKDDLDIYNDIDKNIELYLRYKSGDGIDKDLHKSFSIIKEIVDKTGNAKAEFYLAESYEKGYGVAKDDKIAFYHYEKSANNGYIESQVYLAECYLNGYLTDKNYEQTLSWIEKIIDNNILEFSVDRINIIIKFFTSVIEKFEDMPYDDMQRDSNLLNINIETSFLLACIYRSKFLYDPKNVIYYSKYCLKLILNVKDKYLSIYYKINYYIGDVYYRGSTNFPSDYSNAVKYYKRSLGFSDTTNDIIDNYSFGFNEKNVIENLAYCYGEGGYGLHQDKDKCKYWLQKIYDEDRLDDDILNVYLSEEDGYIYTSYQDDDIEENYINSKNTNSKEYNSAEQATHQNSELNSTNEIYTNNSVSNSTLYTSNISNNGQINNFDTEYKNDINDKLSSNDDNLDISNDVDDDIDHKQSMHRRHRRQKRK